MPLDTGFDCTARIAGDARHRFPIAAEGDLPDAEQLEELTYSDEVATREWGRPSRYAKEMRCI